MNSANRLVVLGSSNTDMVIKSNHLPAPGETVLGGHFQMIPGGKGANQAVAAARLGTQVDFIGKVGSDLFGQEAKSGLQKEGIQTNFLFQDPDHASGIALIMVDEFGENCISVALGANAQLTPSDIDEASYLFDNGAILLVQLEVPLETVQHAILKAKAHQMQVILNPAPAQALPRDLIEKTDIITPNESEASILTGIDVVDPESARKAASNLRELGADVVIITLGKRGAYVLSNEIDQIIETPIVQAMDTTAAGDTFNGALAQALTNHESLENAVRFANKAAAFSVTRMGAQTSCPTLEDLVQFKSP